MCVYIKKKICKLHRKGEDVECEEESEDVFHSRFRVDNESINESEMSTL